MQGHNGDLIDAASVFGLRGTAFKGLSLNSLRIARDPLVLHVMSNGQLAVYNHWVLFLGVEDDFAKVLDGSGILGNWQLADLLVKWDGFAIAIHKHAQPLSNYGAAETSYYLWRVALGIIAFGFLSLWFGRGSNFLGLCGVLVSGIISVTLASQWCDAASILRNPNIVAYIRAAKERVEFATIKVDELEKLINSEVEMLLIDARYEDDAKRGMLPGAINIPVDSDVNLIHAVVSRFTDRSIPVVVYCQSASCGFSETIAMSLLREGFRDIRIYRDGWIGWLEFTKSLKVHGLKSTP